MRNRDKVVKEKKKKQLETLEAKIHRKFSSLIRKLLDYENLYLKYGDYEKASEIRRLMEKMYSGYTEIRSRFSMTLYRTGITEADIELGKKYLSILNSFVERYKQKVSELVRRVKKKSILLKSDEMDILAEKKRKIFRIWDETNLSALDLNYYIKNKLMPKYKGNPLYKELEDINKRLNKDIRIYEKIFRSSFASKTTRENIEHLKRILVEFHKAVNEYKRLISERFLGGK